MKMYVRYSCLIVLASCPIDTEPCWKHCWEYEQEVPDVEGSPDGYFDDLCDNWHGGAMEAPIPPSGSFGARACITGQGEHERVKTVIAAILANDTGSLSQAEKDAYENLVSEYQPGMYTTYNLSDSARITCMVFLTCDFEYCDVDPSVAGDQACDEESAQTLCEFYVSDLLEAALDWDTGTDVPEYSVPLGYNEAEGECDYCPEAGSSGDYNCTTPADETGEQADPFGDLDMLVSCSPQTSCTVDAELIWNIQTHFDQFFTENVALTIGASGAPCNVTGAKISGLGTGEDSKELATKFGLLNNDVITVVEGISLTSEANAAQVIYDLETTTDPVTMTVARRGGSSCTALTYTITPTGY